MLSDTTMFSQVGDQSAASQCEDALQPGQLPERLEPFRPRNITLPRGSQVFHCRCLLSRRLCTLDMII